MVRKYYENEKVMDEEKLRRYGGFGLDEKEEVVYYRGNNEENEMRVFKLDVKCDKKRMVYKGGESGESLFL